jgi:hypothetical protein
VSRAFGDNCGVPVTDHVKRADLRLDGYLWLLATVELARLFVHVAQVLSLVSAFAIFHEAGILRVQMAFSIPIPQTLRTETQL